MNQGLAEKKKELMRYWILVRGKFVHLTVFVVGVTLLATLIVNMMTPVYQGTALVLLKPEHVKNVSLEDMFNAQNRNNNYFETQRDIIKSRSMLGKVVDKIGLDPTANLILGKSKFAWLYSILGLNKPLTQEKKRQIVLNLLPHFLTVSDVKGTSLVEISFQSHSRHMAANFTNTLADTYIQDTIASRVHMANQAIAWIRQRADTLKQQLAVAQGRLQAYISAHHVVLMGKGQSNSSNNPLSLTSQELVDLTTRKIQARSNLDSLEQTYGPLHPKVIAAKAELRKAEAALARGESQSRALGRTNVKLAALQNEVNSTSDLYNAFANRLKEAAQVSTLQTATARIVDPAIIPLDPIKPKKAMIITTALLFSLVFGVGIIILIDKLKSTILSVDEIEARLGLPVLGLVPMLSFAEEEFSDRSALLEKMTSKENHQFIEAIHTIRTGIMLSAIDNPHKSIMVTSSVPKEGKSTFACNLAIAMGNIGRVLLIDADLRKPNVAKYFNTNPAANGLTEYVSGTADLKDCMETSDKYGIDVMHTGMRPPDPLEFLSSKRFKTALANLEKKYDRIILDTAPINAVSDSLMLSQVVKGIVFVVKANATPDLVINTCIKRLKHVEAPIIGAILSQVDTKVGSVYDYGGYYDDYGYSKGVESVPAKKNEDGKRPRFKRKSRSKPKPAVIEEGVSKGHADAHALNLADAEMTAVSSDEHALDVFIDRILDNNKKA